ncbi:unnamed protein product [Peronospora farinosa]|uniref:Uncharacterized protein n=1 Tax=Peronospora farinosa TaxID=134698 RepID=A0ABN8BV54_9STRA|nr:unnamed protein product [Peronospora farinosa]
MALSKPMEMMAAATAAGVGGFLSTSILHPLDTLKTRIQSGASLLPEDNNVTPTKKNKHMTLLKSLYQGIQYKAAESSTSKFMYFYAYTMLAQMATPKDGKPIGTLTDLGIGYLSELCHLPVTMPMELVGTRMQTGSDRRSSTRHLSGSKNLYLRKFKQASQALGALEVFVLGAIARSIATIILFPYIRAKVLMQTKPKQKDVRNLVKDQDISTEPKKTIASTLQRVYTEEGALALYRGLGPELTRGALSSALMLMIKEKVQMYIMVLMMVASSA